MTAKEELQALLAEPLAKRGFRRRGENWHRLCFELYSVVNLQQSRWDALFYLNLGFAPANRVEREWLPESKCPVRFRAEAIKQVSAEDFRLLSEDAVRDMEEADWRAVVVGKIVSPLVGVLDHAADLSGLKRVLQVEVSDRVMIHSDMRPLLCLS